MPVMAQAVLFIVAPVMLGSCCPPELILDALDGLMDGLLGTMWVVLGHSTVMEKSVVA